MQYSGFWRRFGATCIDGLILTIPSLAAGALIPFVGGFVIQLFYKPVFEASPLMGTPGKALMGIAVVDPNGQRITLKQSYIRYFSSILSGLILCFGYIMAAFTARKQSLHDMIADTYVIHRFAPDVNYFVIWINELKRLFGALDNTNLPTESLGSNSSANGAPAPTASSADPVMTLEQLHKLFQSGALSESEYNAKKEEILKKI